MEVAAQPPAFLLTGGDQPLPRALQLLGQQHRMHGHRHRSGQDPKDLSVGCSEGVLTRAHPNHQHPDVLALMLQ